jgi:hypothetical protein
MNADFAEKKERSAFSAFISAQTNRETIPQVKVCMWTGMRERPKGFVAIVGLNNGCNADLQNVFWLDDWIQIHRNVQQDFVVCFYELKRKLGESKFFSHVDLAVGAHGVDIPIARRGHVEFPVLGLVFYRNEEFKTGCLPQVVFADGGIGQSAEQYGINFTGHSITDGELILQPFDFTGDLNLWQVTCWVRNKLERFQTICLFTFPTPPSS